ncbi:DUF1963 domain-containing protein [Chitinophaga filiformis]|uniref:DUF1963 domain-containing protein n=1 Tax=Chitinophaga filiformis TaxID=104663 RepID=A0ABY4HUH9_CHIFI|nr:DUF1963 domain-containing protein [Chitinophaga filiformis]UPK67444.1 DUF1963 domain-containing protein [Chitinophaga filiformis]
MQSTITDKCSLSFPSIYEHILTFGQSITAEHREGDKCLSYVSISMEELSFYDYYEGNDLTARFRESCLEERGTVEVIADRTLPVAGRKSDIRTAQSPEGIFYYFGLVPVSDEYGYIITADCTVASREFYEPLFEQIWQSLQYFDEPARTPAKGAATDITSPEYRVNTDNAENDGENIPAEGGEYWLIGPHTFTLNAESRAYISEGGGELYVRIEGQAPDYMDPQESDIINSYSGKRVYLEFYFRGIYQSGIPTGKFHFEQERNNTTLTYVWKGGFQYSQELTADVVLENGWLFIIGHFNKYPVKVAASLRIDNLSWEHYRFLSPEELRTADPGIVHRLSLTDPDPGILEALIHPLTRLQVLSIDFRDNKQAAGFKEVPRTIRRLTELKDLSLTGVIALDRLPDWLGDLKKLETIRLADSRVESIPPAIWQLPVLKKLYLGNNQLQSVHPTLAESLETLVLENNRLISVPEQVARLRYLNIENNPLQHLPAGVENIPQLNLELAKKMSLLDYSYKGADGRGTIPYDDSRFYARYDPALLQLLEDGIRAAGLDRFRDGLARYTRRSIALETTVEDTYTEKGNHRFGGLPDLPPGLSYPSFIDAYAQERGLQFIAQINCAAIAPLQDYLPRTGMLYFFVRDLQDQEEMGPEVLYYDGDISQLQSAKDLDIEPAFIYDDQGIYRPFRVKAGKYPDIPVMYNTRMRYPALADMEDMYEETEKLKNGFKASSVNPMHSMNSHVFKQHDTPEMEAANAKKGKPEEWMVLLRVGSDNNPGFQFWDAGEIYFVIHKSDLEKKDFSNVYCGLESS